MDDNQEYSAVVDDLHVIQYFGTNAEHLADTIFNLCISDLVSLAPAIGSFFQELFSDDESLVDTIPVSVQKFTKTFYALLEVKSEILLHYLHEVVLTIPPNKVLPDPSAILCNSIPPLDHHHKTSTDEDDSSKSVNEANISDLSKALKQAKDYKATLQAKLMSLSVLENSLGGLTQDAVTYSKKIDLDNIAALLSYSCMGLQ